MNKFSLYKFDEDNIDSIISREFRYFGIDKKLENSKLVIIKPNLVTDIDKYIQNGANTDVRIIESVIKYLSTFNCKVVIVESETGTKIKGRKLNKALELMGVKKLKDKYNFDIINLTNDVQVTVNFNGCILKCVKMGKTSLDADLIINIPKLKTHKYSTITCSLKNMFGLIPDPLRVIYHRNIHKILADLNNLFIDKTFVILDAIKCMEGQGPIYGTPVDMNLIGFCDDMLVNDYIGAKIMGIDPFEVKHIKYFNEKYHNIALDKISFRGKLKVEDVAIKFEPCKKNLFIRIEEQLMRNPPIVRFLLSDFIRKNVFYHMRKGLKKLRGGSYDWHVK